MADSSKYHWRLKVVSRRWWLVSRRQPQPSQTLNSPSAQEVIVLRSGDILNTLSSLRTLPSRSCLHTSRVFCISDTLRPQCCLRSIKSFGTPSARRKKVQDRIVRLQMILIARHDHALAQQLRHGRSDRARHPGRKNQECERAYQEMPRTQNTTWRRRCGIPLNLAISITQQAWWHKHTTPTLSR